MRRLLFRCDVANPGYKVSRPRSLCCSLAALSGCRPVPDRRHRTTTPPPPRLVRRPQFWLRCASSSSWPLIGHPIDLRRERLMRLFSEALLEAAHAFPFPALVRATASLRYLLDTTVSFPAACTPSVSTDYKPFPDVRIITPPRERRHSRQRFREGTVVPKTTLWASMNAAQFDAKPDSPRVSPRYQLWRRSLHYLTNVTRVIAKLAKAYLANLGRPRLRESMAHFRWLTNRVLNLLPSVMSR
jgi:hypothetical protein